MRINTMKKIPKFKTEAEERDFWANADSSDYIDWSKARRVLLPISNPRSGWENAFKTMAQNGDDGLVDGNDNISNPDKPTSKKQKYHTTLSGRSVIKATGE